MSIPMAALTVFLLFVFCFLCVVVAVSFGLVGVMALVLLMGVWCAVFTEKG